MEIDLKIDKTSIIPVYYQIMEYLRECIHTKKLQPGDQLPAEREFCEMFDISRMTVRQALEPLVKEGLLEKIKGKGTFVNSPKVSRPLKGLSSFTVDTISGGKVPNSKVLSFEVFEADTVIATTMGIKEGDRVIKLARLRLEDDNPHAFECSYLNYARAKNILDEDMSKASLYATLTKKCNITLDKARETIEAMECPEEIGKLLGLAPHTYTFHRQRVTRDNKDEIIEYVVSEYRMDKFVFVVELDNKK